jgi:hypothetical protein
MSETWDKEEENIKCNIRERTFSTSSVMASQALLKSGSTLNAQPASTTVVLPSPIGKCNASGISITLDPVWSVEKNGLSTIGGKFAYCVISSAGSLVLSHSFTQIFLF